MLISVPWGQHTNPEYVFKELIDLVRQAMTEAKPLHIDEQAAVMLLVKVL